MLNSKLIEDMPSPSAIAELDFLIARFIGAFKLRQLRFGPLVFLIAVRQIPIAGLLFKPWYRATVLTGDRIGLVASGDVQATMAAMAKLAVGPEGLGGYSLAGHIEQSKRARGGFFYVIYRWSSDFPHMTDRVLDLAACARSSNAVTIPAGAGPVIDDLNRALSQA